MTDVKYLIKPLVTHLFLSFIVNFILFQDRCANYSVTCYCPSIGSCAEKQYRIPLNRLTNDGKHKGDHNRNYFFTIKVTNLANLSNIEHVDILVDDSPPETGVVYEGNKLCYM